MQEYRESRSAWGSLDCDPHPSSSLSAYRRTRRQPRLRSAIALYRGHTMPPKNQPIQADLTEEPPAQKSRHLPLLLPDLPCSSSIKFRLLESPRNHFI